MHGVAAQRAVVRVACSVASGMVLTVLAVTRLTTYSVSGSDGSFVEVEAHSGRCTFAPLAASACQRGVASFCSYSS